MSPDASQPRSSFLPLLPEGAGVVLYVRDARAPWTVRRVVGDAPGVFGVPAAALRTVWAELLHPDDASGCTSALAAVEPGGTSTIEYRVRPPEGGERWLKDSMRRSPAPEGGEHLVGVVRDVSAERALRTQVAVLEERLWRAQRMDSLGEIAVGIAHDLGNLFTGVLGTVREVGEDPALPAHLRDELEVVRSGIDRGSGFVRQILRFAARERYNPGPVDLHRVVEDLRGIVARTLSPRIRLTIEGEPGLPELHADPAQLEQVVLNLVVNAKEAMSSGGHLGIRTESVHLAEPLVAVGGTLLPGPYLRLSVTDTGEGIPSEVRGRIFEPSFSTKVRPASGSGFGLSTVDRIVRGLGGGITLESEASLGTRFRVYLPVRAPAPALPEVGEAEGDGPPRGRILLVEDDPAVRKVTLRILAREGFSAMAVGAAREALQIFDRVRPQFQVVVCDIALPDRSGPELMHLLRNRVPDLPVVYISGYDREKLPVTLGAASSFLEKPFTPRDLVAAVDKALAGGGEHAREVEGAQGG